MKLITEYRDSKLKTLTEGLGSERKLYIEGIFMQAEKKNRNNRVYTRQILEAAVQTYVKEQVLTARAVGELGHPEGATINLDKVSHRITELKWNGDDIIGRALILNTPMGLIVKGLVEGGVMLGVSSRGMGNVETRGGVSYVADDFILATVDIVQDPSAPAAFVEGIMEGVEFFKQGNEFIAQRIAEVKKVIHKTSKSELASAQVRVFESFINQVARKAISDTNFLK